MKKLKRFFASILCICMIITSCPDLLAWAAGDTAVGKPVTYRLTANSLSKMVRKAELEKTEENGLCKLKLPKGFNKTLGKTKLHVYLQPDEDNLVFVFENKADKRQGAALIVDNRKSDIFAIPTKAEIYEELGYEYASDSNADEDEIDSEGLLGDDFQDLEAEIVDDAATGSDNNADEKYDYLEGYATHMILNNKKHTAGVAFTVSLDELGIDSLGELLPEEEDEIIATDSNAEETVPSVPEKIPTVTPPEVIEATPSDAIPVTVATPSNVAKTFIAEVGGVTIRAHAEAGVLPDEAIFEAIELKEAGDTADAYKEACETLDADEETVYDGVMAYDLHFLLNGEEVQPDGEVQIAMEVSKEVLSDKIDPESVEVKHLEEEGGNLAVQTVADIEDAAEGTVEVKADTSVTAEFAVQSFSYFLITYRGKTKLYTYLYDDEGTEIKGTGKITSEATYKPEDFGAKWDADDNSTGAGGEKRANKWVSMEAQAGTFGAYTEGYTYIGAYLKNSDFSSQQPIKWIYCYNERWDNGSNNRWYYSTSDDRPTDPPTSKTPYIKAKSYWDQNLYLYLVYSENPDYKSEIKDEEIEQYGWLTFKHDPEDGCTYEWYGSDENDDSYVKVDQRKVTGTTYNIVNDENGTHLYPALDFSSNLENDLSIRRWYKVKKTDQNGVVTWSAPKQVPYYGALQNGKFEEPKTDLINPGGNFFFPNGTTGMIWKTTGNDKQIEIVNKEYGSSHHCTETIDGGDQYAELNAQAEGALYQNVLTTPGATLSWHLAHRGRDGEDTMRLIIAPAKDSRVKNLTTQSEVERLITDIQRSPREWAEKGYFLKADITNGNTEWGEWEGEYKVPAGQYLTTFFFVAGATASKNSTVGNLLDDIDFSTVLPAPDPGKGHVRVTKEILGILDEDVSKYAVEITLESENSNGETYTATQQINFDGSSKIDRTLFRNVDAGKTYKVKETLIPIDNYTWESGSVKVESSAECPYEMNTYVGNITVTEGNTAEVKFTNRYSSKYVDLTVKKAVDGNMGSTTENFTFKIKVIGPMGTPISVAGTYEGKNITGMDTDGFGEFTLSHNESIDITNVIPYGATVTVKEVGYSSRGYTASHICNYDVCEKTDSHTFNTMKDDAVIEFINRRNIVIPTGLFDNGHPTGWLYLMAAVAGCFAFGFYRRRKKKLENGEECL